MAGAEKELASALGTFVHLQVSEAAAPGYRDMSGCICNLRGRCTGCAQWLFALTPVLLQVLFGIDQRLSRGCLMQDTTLPGQQTLSCRSCRSRCCVWRESAAALWLRHRECIGAMCSGSHSCQCHLCCRFCLA